MISNTLIILLGSYIIRQLFPKPIFNLIFQWVRWICFSICFSFILVNFGISSRPFEVHFFIGLCVWYVIETAFYRLSIHIFDSSNIKIFPRYELDNCDKLWPINPHTIVVKEWIAQNKFKLINNIKSNLIKGICIRQAVYLNNEKTVKLIVYFLPSRNGKIKLNYSFTSKFKSGDLFITDNQNIPFGGFYPDHWKCERKPLITNINSLFLEHTKNVINEGDSEKYEKEETLFEINEIQKNLEDLNIKKGFIHYSNNLIKLTPFGIYRLWKEMWLLAYLGKTIKHKQ